MIRIHKKFQSILSDPRFEAYTFLFVLALVLGLAFLPFLGRLGFYLDDWPHIFFGKVGGSFANQLFHAYDGRPLSGWFYILLGDLMGYHPLRWQIFTLIVRFITVFLMWLTFRIIWPQAHWQVGAAALLFAVYPIFAQQSISVAFSVHWFSFLCFFVSIYLMVLAISRQRYFWLLTLLSLGFSVVSLILIEYFVGVELLRIVLVWLMFKSKAATIRNQVGLTIKTWFPYGVVFAGFVLWRMFFIQLPIPDRNETVIVDQLIGAPIETILKIVQSSIQDFTHTTVSSWYKTFEPGIFDFSERSKFLAIFASIIAGVGAFTYLLASNQKINPQGTNSSKETPWWRRAILVGTAFTFLGPLPGWLVGRTVSSTSGLWNDRFGLAAMFGASILMVALIEWVVTKQKARLVLLAVLVGLAVGWQVRNANDYRWSWTFQSRFYQQLGWRIPALQPGTLLVSDRELFSKVGIYPTSFALNTFFPVDFSEQQLNYYFMSLGRNYVTDIDTFVDGDVYIENRWQAHFKGQTQDSIVIDYRPENRTCLWVLGMEDRLHPLITETTRKALEVSDLNRISRQSIPGYPPQDVFGEHTELGWCNFYQKAELAAQFDDWDTVNQLWDESMPYRDQMNASTELAPFIKGFIHSRNFEEAAELSRQMQVTVSAAEPYLCKIWGDSLSTMELSSEDLSIVKPVMDSLKCDPSAFIVTTGS